MWKKLDEDERYWVSDNGAVRGARGKVLKASRSGDGYYTVNVGGKTRKVAILVAAAFIGPRPPGTQVAHLDGDTSNNAVENLAYVTKAENEAHKIAHGTSNHGERNGNAKLTNSEVLTILTLLEVGFTQNEVANIYGITQSHVSAIKRGEYWQ